MSSTLVLVISSIVILFLIFPLLFFLRRRVELSLEEDILVLEYPLKTKRIDLRQELKSWNVQKAYYIRWGIFYSIMLQFRNGKQTSVSSLFNQKNFDLLYNHLIREFKDRRTAE